MKNRDFKMRERYEQKEYYGDNNGLTRVDKIRFKKLEREIEELKANAPNEFISDKEREANYEFEQLLKNMG